MSGACELPVRESETTKTTVEENAPLAEEPGKGPGAMPAKNTGPEKTPGTAERPSN